MLPAGLFPEEAEFSLDCPPSEEAFPLDDSVDELPPVIPHGESPAVVVFSSAVPTKLLGASTDSPREVECSDTSTRFVALLKTSGTFSFPTRPDVAVPSDKAEVEETEGFLAHDGDADAPLTPFPSEALLPPLKFAILSRTLIVPLDDMLEV